MSSAPPSPKAEPRPFKRRPVGRLGPNRGAGGFYRTAEAKGRKAGGVPLNSPNDALVAAVRMAYKVAEAQVDRSTRLARRLRDAGDRAVGPGSDRKALDATERLVMNSMMSALEWWEASVAEGRCPVKRLAAAEYRMIGTMLGFGEPKTPQGRHEAEEGLKASRSVRRAGAKLAIRHAGQRRAVRVVEWQLDGTRDLDENLEFHHESGEDALKGVFRLVGKTPTLTLAIPDSGAARGNWTAAICARDGEQLGFVEITL